MIVIDGDKVHNAYSARWRAATCMGSKDLILQESNLHIFKERGLHNTTV